MKRKSTGIILILLAMLLVLGGFFSINKIVNDKKVKRDEITYEIAINDEITIYPNEELQLLPYVLNSNGEIVEGRFSFTTDSEDLAVDKNKGVVLLEKLTDKNQIVHIKEDYYNISKDVVLKPTRDLMGVSKLLGDELMNKGIDDKLSLEALTKPTKYDLESLYTVPSQNRYMTVKAYDDYNAEKKVFNININKNVIELEAIGIGSGYLDVHIVNNKVGLDFSAKISFNLMLPSHHLEKLAFEDYNSKNQKTTVLTKSDLEAITKLEYANEELDLGGLEYFKGLKSLSFTENVELKSSSLNFDLPLTYKVDSDKLPRLLSELKEEKPERYQEYATKLRPKTENNKRTIIYHIASKYNTLGEPFPGSDEYVFIELINSYSTLNDYQFKGYSRVWRELGTNKEITSLDMVSDYMHVYGDFTANKYKIILEDYIDGKNKEIEVTYDSAIDSGDIKLTDQIPAKYGWSFAGWYWDDAYSNPAISGSDIYKEIEDKTIYAKYITNITIQYGDILDNMTEEFKAVYGNSIKLASHIHEVDGWSFDGFYVTRGGYDSENGYSLKIEDESSYTYENEIYKDSNNQILYPRYYKSITIDWHHDSFKEANSNIDALTIVDGLKLSEANKQCNNLNMESQEVDGWSFNGYYITYLGAEGSKKLTNDTLISRKEAARISYIDARYSTNAAISYWNNQDKRMLRVERLLEFGKELDLTKEFKIFDYDKNNKIFKENYIFDGWRLNEGEAILYDKLWKNVANTDLVGANEFYYRIPKLEIVATYVAQEYSITFVADSRSPFIVDGVEKLEIVRRYSDTNRVIEDVPNIPELNGYHGYYKRGDEVIYVENNKWIVDKVYGPIRINVFYEPNSYNVTLVDYSGAESIIKVKYNEPYFTVAGEPRAFMTGYSFVGWYLSPDYLDEERIIPGNTINTIAADSRLYARFDATINYSGYQTDGITKLEYLRATYGKPFALPMAYDESFKVEGWSIAGWYTNSRLEGSCLSTYESYDDNRDVHVYYPKYVRSISLEYHSKDFSFTRPISKDNKTIDVVYGQSLDKMGIELFKNTDMADNEFNRAWTLEDWFTGPSFTAAEAIDRKAVGLFDNLDIKTIYAKYNGFISLSFRGNTKKIAVVLDHNTDLFTEEILKEANSLAAKGYELFSWSYIVGTEPVIISKENPELVITPIMGNMTLEGIYELIRYHISFLDEYGRPITNALGKPLIREYTVERLTVDIPKLDEKLGYTGKWLLESDPSLEIGTVFRVPESLIRQNFAIKASYKANEYQIRYDYITGIEVKKVEFGANIENLAPRVAIDGYKLEGWYLDKEYSKPFINTVYETADNITVYAKYTRKIKLVSELPGVKLPSTIKVNYNGRLELPKPTDTTNGWIFRGFYKSNEYLLEEHVVDQEAFKDTASEIIYYAMWEKSLNMHFNDAAFRRTDGSTEKVIKVIYNKPYPELPAIENSIVGARWEFEGWFSDSNYVNRVPGLNTIVNDVHLSDIYSKLVTKIYFDTGASKIEKSVTLNQSFDFFAKDMLTIFDSVKGYKLTKFVSNTNGQDVEVIFSNSVRIIESNFDSLIFKPVRSIIEYKVTLVDSQMKEILVNGMKIVNNYTVENPVIRIDYKPHFGERLEFYIKMNNPADNIRFNTLEYRLPIDEGRMELANITIVMVDFDYYTISLYKDVYKQNAPMLTLETQLYKVTFGDIINSVSRDLEAKRSIGRIIDKYALYENGLETVFTNADLQKEITVANDYHIIVKYRDLRADDLGSGTKSDPYKIEHVCQLVDLANRVNATRVFDDKYFIQTENIDGGSKTYTPIGLNGGGKYYENKNQFYGHYNGNKKIILNMRFVHASNVGDTYAGLFGIIGSNAEVYDLELVNIHAEATTHGANNKKTKGGAHAGALCGINSGIVRAVNTKDCAVTGECNADMHCGGIAGYMFKSGAIIEGCNVGTGYVTGKCGRWSSMGGICGSANNSTIIGCTNSSSIGGNVDPALVAANYYFNFHGGIAGVSASVIINCVNHGEVTGTFSQKHASKYCAKYLGGIIGYMHDGSGTRNEDAPAGENDLGIASVKVSIKGQSYDANKRYASVMACCTSNGTIGRGNVKNVYTFMKDNIGLLESLYGKNMLIIVSQSDINSRNIYATTNFQGTTHITTSAAKVQTATIHNGNKILAEISYKDLLEDNKHYFDEPLPVLVEENHMPIILICCALSLLILGSSSVYVLRRRLVNKGR